jgi:tetratricopeptide (TPR) repeat protein
MAGVGATAGPVGGASGGSPAARTPRGGGASRAKAAAAAAAGEGTSVAAQSKMGWILGGVFFLGIVLILALPMLRPEATPPVTAPGAAGPQAGSGAPPDLSQMTPRQAADRLFERVIRASEAGDQAQVQQFMPMALQAYDMAAPLDLDGRVHVAMLQQAAGDTAQALSISRDILAESPDYLLALFTAAESAKTLGDSAAARQYYQHFLDVYDAEMAKGLEEYTGHGVIIDIARQNAVNFSRSQPSP